MTENSEPDRPLAVTNGDRVATGQIVWRDVTLDAIPLSKLTNLAGR